MINPIKVAKSRRFLLINLVVKDFLIYAVLATFSVIVSYTLKCWKLDMFS